MRDDQRGAVLKRLSDARGRLWADRRAGAAMVFAISFIPAIMMAGLAVDYTRASSYSATLKSATDAAALAGASITYDPSNPSNTNLHALRFAAAQAAFDANIQSASLQNPQFSLQEIANGVQVNASAQMLNAFGQIFQKNSTDIGASAAAALSARKNYEVVFALDNTGSMAEANKMTVLKAAMTKFLNKLQAASSTAANVRVGLVPFDKAVRVDPIGSSGKAWLRQASRDLASWQGCITDRVQNYDVDATTPTISIPNTLFDAVDGNLNIFPVTPSNVSVVPPLSFTPANCGLAMMFPLTESFGAMQSAVNAMTPNGNTNLTIGLAWGLQMLTPGDPFNIAMPFGGGYTKIMVFLTDGQNTQNRWSTTPADIDARTQLACNAIKAKGVTLYTIGVMDENTSLLTNCASSPSQHYFAPTADKIPDLFDLISADLVSIRLVR